MKKSIFGIICLVFWAISTQAQPANGPVMTFKVTTIDYGKVQRGADQYRHFFFTNMGNEPLIIKTAKGSCGCVVPTFPQEPIMPGETTYIDVKYDTNRPGPFTKTITLTTNETPDTHTLTIKGEVLMPPVQESVPASNGGTKQ